MYITFQPHPFFLEERVLRTVFMQKIVECVIPDPVQKENRRKEIKNRDENASRRTER